MIFVNWNFFFFFSHHKIADHFQVLEVAFPVVRDRPEPVLVERRRRSDEPKRRRSRRRRFDSRSGESPLTISTRSSRSRNSRRRGFRWKENVASVFGVGIDDVRPKNNDLHILKKEFNILSHFSTKHFFLFLNQSSSKGNLHFLPIFIS